MKMNLYHTCELGNGGFKINWKFCVENLLTFQVRSENDMKKMCYLWEKKGFRSITYVSL